MKTRTPSVHSRHAKNKAPINHDHFIVPPGTKIRLKDYDPGFTGSYKTEEEASPKLRKDIQRLAKLQNVLYADNTRALLVVLQGMDAAGKDGTIRHVMSGVNPQGTQVHSFKAPSAEELEHDFLWRSTKALPERGGIGIFNRSYYEEVLVVRVHPEILNLQHLPPEAKGKNIWRHRFDAINDFERFLTRNGIGILKFFLNLSKEEQKRRFLERIDTPDKNWKFSVSDAKERGHWDEYMAAFEDALHRTSTEWAPWYIIPADNKWFTHVVVADVIIEKLKSFKLNYPVAGKEHRRQLLKAKRVLENESSKGKR
jgi:PPK2 family polyphosphate:nucleotide phosphotransferase